MMQGDPVQKRRRPAPMTAVALMAGSLVVIAIVVATVPAGIARRHERNLAASGCPKPPLVEASFEDRSPPGLAPNVLRGTMATVSSPVAYHMAHAIAVRYRGGGDVGYARVQRRVSWADGDEVWYGGAYYFPPEFLRSVQDTVDLMRWDNFPSHPNDTDHGGLTIWSDGGLRLIKEQRGRRPYTVLIEGGRVPAGRWVWLEVHQRFSAEAGEALSEIYVDAVRVGHSNQANFYGRPVQMLRYGIVAVGTPDQRQPLSLYLDRVTVGECEVGPRSWSEGQG